MRLAVEAAKLGTWNVDLVAGTRVWSEEFRAIVGLDPSVRPDTEQLQVDAAGFLNLLLVAAAVLGHVFGAHGAPRWKQRALYDAMKDAAAATGQVRLARVSIYDRVEGHALNDVLYGRVEVPAEAIGRLVEMRTS